MSNKSTCSILTCQNDITKHYRDIIDNINAAIEWAVAEGMHVVYIKRQWANVWTLYADVQPNCAPKAREFGA